MTWRRLLRQLPDCRNVFEVTPILALASTHRLNRRAVELQLSLATEIARA